MRAWASLGARFGSRAARFERAVSSASVGFAKAPGRMTTRALLPLLATLACAAFGCIVQEDREFADLYEACVRTSDCYREADGCFLVALDAVRKDRMCSRYCEVDADCPGGGACFALEGDPSDARICFARCRRDADCELGFVCAVALEGQTAVDDICVPE